jgi:beta-phosphoglucomutase-like phosphatase (HAD superfamily)
MLRSFLKRVIKAVIFDLDGVLVEAKEWHKDALNQALKLFGCDILTKEHKTLYDGLPTKLKLKMLQKNKNLPIELHDLIFKLKQIYTHELFVSKCLPNFHQQYLFRKLKQKKIEIAVASNSIRQTINEAILRLDIKKYVRFSLSNEDVKNPKPDPEIYLKAISMLNLEPKECLIIEDNFYGIAAAKAAKAHCMEVKKIEEVNYIKIFNYIKSIEGR